MATSSNNPGSVEIIRRVYLSSRQVSNDGVLEITGDALSETVSGRNVPGLEGGMFEIHFFNGEVVFRAFGESNQVGARNSLEFIQALRMLFDLYGVNYDAFERKCITEDGTPTGTHETDALSLTRQTSIVRSILNQ